MLSTDFQATRREDPPLLTGQGCYTADVQGQALHAVFVRSPLAHGRLRAVRAQAALAMPGVVAVLTAETLTPGGEPVFMPAPNPLLPVAQVPRVEPLARQAVVYVGQPVALVLAQSLSQARQAAQCVTLDIEPLQAVADFEGETVTEVAHSHAGTDAEGPLTEVAVSLAVPRVLAMAMEPRGMLARWHDGEAGPARLTVHMGSQSPSRAQADIARALGWDTAQVRVVTGQVGGAFGAKSSLTPEDLAVALAALRLARWPPAGPAGRSALWRGRLVAVFGGGASAQHGAHPARPLPG